MGLVMLLAALISECWVYCREALYGSDVQSDTFARSLRAVSQDSSHLLVRSNRQKLSAKMRHLSIQITSLASLASSQVHRRVAMAGSLDQN